MRFRRKYYTDVYPKCKEDLIGTWWKCPGNKCFTKIKINEDGIKHWGYKHGVINSLEDLYELRLWEIETSKKLFYGVFQEEKEKED